MLRKPKNYGEESLLVVHGSSDLYGADRTVIDLVKRCVEKYKCVHVALPGKGLLVKELNNLGAIVHMGHFSSFGRRSVK